MMSEIEEIDLFFNKFKIKKPAFQLFNLKAGYMTVVRNSNPDFAVISKALKDCRWDSEILNAYFHQCQEAVRLLEAQLRTDFDNVVKLSIQLGVCTIVWLVLWGLDYYVLAVLLAVLVTLFLWAGWRDFYYCWQKAATVFDLKVKMAILEDVHKV